MKKGKKDNEGVYRAPLLIHTARYATAGWFWGRRFIRWEFRKKERETKREKGENWM